MQAPNRLLIILLSGITLFLIGTLPVWWATDICCCPGNAFYSSRCVSKIKLSGAADVSSIPCNEFVLWEKTCEFHILWKSF